MSLPIQSRAALTINGELELVEVLAQGLGCNFAGEFEESPEMGEEYRSASAQLEVCSDNVGGIFTLTPWWGEAQALFAGQVAVLDGFLKDAAAIDLSLAEIIEGQASAIMTARRRFRVIRGRLLKASAQVSAVRAAGQFTEAQVLESAAMRESQTARTAVLGVLKAATELNTAQMTESAEVLGVLSDRVSEMSILTASRGVGISVDPAELRGLSSLLRECSTELKVPAFVGTRVMNMVWNTHPQGITDAFKRAVAASTEARATLLERIRAKLNACAANLNLLAAEYESSDELAAAALGR